MLFMSYLENFYEYGEAGRKGYLYLVLKTLVRLVRTHDAVACTNTHRLDKKGGTSQKSVSLFSG